MTNNKSKSKPEAEKEDKTPDEMAGEILDAVMTCDESVATVEIGHSRILSLHL